MSRVILIGGIVDTAPQGWVLHVSPGIIPLRLDAQLVLVRIGLLGREVEHENSVSAMLVLAVAALAVSGCTPQGRGPYPDNATKAAGDGGGGSGGGGMGGAAVAGIERFSR